MLGKLSSADGLLLLFEAAKHVVNDGEKPKISKPSLLSSSSSSSITNTNFDYSKSRQNNFQFNHPIGSSNRKQTQKFPPRSSHNELEKSRRAHLRTCMEALKLHLNFDTDATRITMLSILKKASKTIQELKEENKSLQEAEIKQKSRWNQLMKKKNHLKKRIENRKYNRKIQNWRERNRNYSECSIATTSSEDSELDLHPRGSNNQQEQQRLTFQTPSPMSINSQMSNNTLTITNPENNTNNNGKVFMQKSGHSSAGTSPPPAFTNVYDALDGCSLDSGYEENQLPTPNSSCNGEIGIISSLSPSNRQACLISAKQSHPQQQHSSTITTNNHPSSHQAKVFSANPQYHQHHDTTRAQIITTTTSGNINNNNITPMIGMKRILPSPFKAVNMSQTAVKKFQPTFIRTDVPVIVDSKI